MISKKTSLKWAILCTGWGRNAKDTIKAYNNKELGSSVIDLLIYEQNECGAAEEAKKIGIATIQIKRNEFKDQSSYQEHITATLLNRNIDFVFMLNYKYRVRQKMLCAFPNRIINIHPSLFPSFLGTKTAIQDALDYGVKITGITTHIIDHELDKGSILCQKPIEVKPNDTFDSLYPKFVNEGKKIIVKTILKMEKTSFCN
jgi:phosphoribosylglycinamide formyltransferase-1